MAAVSMAKKPGNARPPSTSSGQALDWHSLAALGQPALGMTEGRRPQFRGGTKGAVLSRGDKGTKECKYCGRKHFGREEAML